MEAFFLNGNQSSDFKITEDMKIYKWLEENYHVNDNEIPITREILEELQDVDLPKTEEKLVGNLLYNVEYNFGGYIFIKKEDIYCCEHKWCLTDGVCPGFNHELGDW